MEQPKKTTPTSITPPEKLLKAPEKKEESNLGNTAWIVVLVIILLIALASYFIKPSSISNAWQSILANAFSGIGSGKDSNDMTVSLSSTTVSSGSPVFLSFKLNKNVTAPGEYSLLYSCSGDLKITIRSIKDLPVTCGQPFDLTGYASSSINLIPTTLQNKASTTIEITFSPTASSTENVDASAIKSGVALEVQKAPTLTQQSGNSALGGTKTAPPATTKTPATPAPTGQLKTPTAGEPTSKYYQIGAATDGSGTNTRVVQSAPADLAVTIVAVGKIDPATNEFIATNDLKSTDEAAIKFKIANKGPGSVEGWTFSAALPITPSYTFVSEGQQNLNSGEYIVYTIGFDHIQTKNGNKIKIAVDPQGLVTDSDKENDVATAIIGYVAF